VGDGVGEGVGAGVGEGVGGAGVGLAVHDVPVGQQLVCPLLGWNLPSGQAWQTLLQMHFVLVPHEPLYAEKPVFHFR
jgi:hypothetical protein